MNNLKDTKTAQNLRFAFSGESEARNKYEWFAETAKNEGYEQIAAIFRETAENEKAHGEIWFKALQGISNTEENLRNAANSEHYEWAEMYLKFAEEARTEGFSDIAQRLENVAAIEKAHEERYLKLLANLEAGRVFKKDAQTHWICRNCGYAPEGTEAPEICPVCGHMQAFFQVKAENY